MYLGIDLGTSSVKALLVDDAGRSVAEAGARLAVERPRPLWSEQDPEAWWSAVLQAVDALRAQAGAALSAVRGIGLSGQMHGATLLDAADRPLRPAILWNDGRSAAQCRTLAARVRELEEITGNRAMPGFTAPKLLWVDQHEPELFARIAKVLLPKDFVRLRLSGDHASDMSDSSGTLFLDVRCREWSPAVLEAVRLSERHMPVLYEGPQATGALRAELAQRWGMSGAVAIAAGAGDNAAGAVGLGVVRAGQGFASLGTSGVLFVASDRCEPHAQGGVHTFCHALPKTWHQMSVILSAASCLSWLAGVLGANEAELLESAAKAPPGTGALLFLPYLSGERTPHNDPHAKGVFFGLGHDTGRAELARALLEGVAFAFADGQQALLEAGSEIEQLWAIGGGARGRLWLRILASALGRALDVPQGAELGAAAGAARLARVAASGEPPERAYAPPAVRERIEPEPAWSDIYRERRARFRRLYPALRDAFQEEEPA
jgi:xylulokinase